MEKTIERCGIGWNKYLLGKRANVNWTFVFQLLRNITQNEMKIF